MGRRRGLQRVALAGVVALTATACLSEEGGGSSGGGGGTSGDKNVEIIFGFGGSQSKGFQESLKAFQSSSGIKIKFTEASQSFDTLIRTRVQGNNTPDIALFPQPGLLLDFAKQGKLTDLSTQLDLEKLKSDLVPGVLAPGTADDGKPYGSPVSMNVKSLVFYNKPAWEKAGYPTPKTQQELLTLTDKIRSEGKTPWCLGIESGPATGWPATDWLEEYVLRLGGVDKYQQWVKHQIPFDDPLVKQAGEAFAKIAFTDGNVLGGRKGIVTNAFSTAGNPMFNATPSCWMYRMGNFITQKGFFPDKVTANVDNQVGVFYFPGESADNQPVLVGGDLAAVFNGKDDDTKAVMQYITGADYKGWDEDAGFLSPRKTFPLDNYKHEITKQIAKIGYEASVAGFDGSDQMPGAVGAGSFWKGMVAWVNGQKDLDATLKDIQQSWPS